jgi:hypothetical protein
MVLEAAIPAHMTLNQFLNLYSGCKIFMAWPVLKFPVPKIYKHLK